MTGTFLWQDLDFRPTPTPNTSKGITTGLNLLHSLLLGLVARSTSSDTQKEESN